MDGWSSYDAKGANGCLKVGYGIVCGESAGQTLYDACAVYLDEFVRTEGVPRSLKVVLEDLACGEADEGVLS